MSDKNDYNANLFGDSLDILLALAVRQAAQIASLQTGVYEGALGDMPPTCPHTNTIYAHCLACVIEKRDAEIERLKWMLNYLLTHPNNRPYPRLEDETEYLFRLYAAHQPEDGKP